MVSVDEQHPYLLYGPQQDNSTVVVPSVPTVSFGFDHPAQAWTQASGCETGGIWPTPDGKVIWGACKGEVERFNVETGQSQGRWIYPQNRYGHHPDDIKFRFPRQTVVMVSPHDPKTRLPGVARPAPVDRRRRDVAGDQPGPDRAREGVPDRPGQPDHARRDRRRGLFVDLLDGRVAARARRALGRRQRRSGARDARQRQDVEERDAEGSAAGRTRAEHRAPRRIARARPTSPSTGTCASTTSQPYIYKTDDYGATWTKLTSGANGIPDDHPTRVVREDPERAGLLYAGTEFGFFVSFDNGGDWQPLQQNLPATPVTDIRVHRGDLVISTMGRSFWIMDDVSPLRQLAAAASRTTSSPDSGGVYRGAPAMDTSGRPAGVAHSIPIGSRQARRRSI